MSELTNRLPSAFTYPLSSLSVSLTSHLLSPPNISPPQFGRERAALQQENGDYRRRCGELEDRLEKCTAAAESGVEEHQINKLQVLTDAGSHGGDYRYRGGGDRLLC